MLLFMGVSLVIPLYWNSLSRFEYYTKRVSGFFGSNVTGCYFLAGTGMSIIHADHPPPVFNFSLLRNYLYELAVADQVQAIPELMPLSLLSWPLFIAGSVLVLSSMYKLGITGTYNGDYFGIFMKERVTSFPFSVTGNPMYTGSTMIFFSYACYKASVCCFLLRLLTLCLVCCVCHECLGSCRLPDWALV